MLGWYKMKAEVVGDRHGVWLRDNYNWLFISSCQQTSLKKDQRHELFKLLCIFNSCYLSALVNFFKIAFGFRFQRKELLKCCQSQNFYYIIYIHVIWSFILYFSYIYFMFYLCYIFYYILIICLCVYYIFLILLYISIFTLFDFK